MAKNSIIVLIIFLSALSLIINHKAISAKKGKESNENKLKIVLLEEFPTEENLAKLALFDFPIDIFVAAKNVSEFEEIKREIRKYSSVRTIGYWPTLKKEEGYWISAFSKRRGIERIINELNNVNYPLSVLWDAELPHLRKRLFLTELPYLLGNRKIIQNFVANPPEKVTLYIAENRKRGALYKLILKMFATTFEPELKYNQVEMLYGQLSPEVVEQSLKAGIEREGGYYPAFGATAEGVGGSAGRQSWMRISPQKLEEQLEIAQRLGIKRVFVYRLGGLNKEYVEVFRKDPPKDPHRVWVTLDTPVKP